jgi:hypothetical protein
MDRVRDPFTPGAGVRPPYVAGRAQEIQDFDIALQRALLGRAVRGTILTGVRGMGKTVLLKEMEEAADSRHWAVVSMEADQQGGFPGQLSHEASRAVHALIGKPVISERLRRLADRVRSVRLGADVAGNATLGVDFAESSAEQSVGARDLAEVLVSTAAAMREQLGTGLLVCVDELQQLDDMTLHALSLASHRASQELTPFVLLGAGLPELPGRLARVTSYAEKTLRLCGA